MRDGGYAVGSDVITCGMMSYNKGGCYALDDLCDTRNTLDVGVGERLHDWRIHSCTAGYSNRGGVDQNNFRTKTVLTTGRKKGEQVQRRLREKSVCCGKQQNS